MVTLKAKAGNIVLHREGTADAVVVGRRLEMFGDTLVSEEIHSEIEFSKDLLVSSNTSLHFDEQCECIYVQTTYETTRPLRNSELESITEATQAVWADNYTYKLIKEVEHKKYFVDLWYLGQDISVEQA